MMETVEPNVLDYSEQLQPNNECRYYLPVEFKDQFIGLNPSLSILHLNARSLNSNFDSINLLLQWAVCIKNSNCFF